MVRIWGIPLLYLNFIYVVTQRADINSYPVGNIGNDLTRHSNSLVQIYAEGHMWA